MYEELVKTMRHCVANMDCLNCPVESIDKTAKAQKRCLTLVLSQAADAIEKLRKIAENMNIAGQSISKKH